MRKLATFLLVLALAALAAGCGSDDEDTAGTTAAATTAAAAEDCVSESLETITDGRLTIGTDNPAFPPWFEGGTPEGSDWEINDPATGEGFESAVAYAVADELGFAEGRRSTGSSCRSTTPSGPATRASTSTSTRSPSPRSATARSTSATPTTTSTRPSSHWTAPRSRTLRRPPTSRSISSAPRSGRRA